MISPGRISNGIGFDTIKIRIVYALLLGFPRTAEAMRQSEPKARQMRPAQIPSMQRILGKGSCSFKKSKP